MTNEYCRTPDPIRLDRHPRKNTPDAPAIATASQVISCDRLHQRMTSARSGLAALGIKKGDGFGVQLPNGLESVVAFLAIAARGTIMKTLRMPAKCLSAFP